MGRDHSPHPQVQEGDGGKEGEEGWEAPARDRIGGQASKAKHWTPLKLVTKGGSLAPAWCPAQVLGAVGPLVPEATSSEPGHRKGLKRKGWVGLTC